MRAFGICVARSFSGQKTEFSADVQSFWSTFKPGTRTILCVSKLSVIASFYKNTWLSYSTLASEGSLTILIDILKNFEFGGCDPCRINKNVCTPLRLLFEETEGKKKLKKWIGILEDKVSVSSFSIHLRSGDHYADTAFKYLCIIAWYFNNGTLHSPYMLGTVNKLGV